ncbi:MAG: response regulator [Bacteroidales bacterium]|jgi:DNA-binding NarL/FixJ family response regulator|nr:response regulator [Bacteroidales bacterium]
MNILIVEDDDKKRGSVLSYLHQEFDGLKIDEGYSVESGVQKAVDNQYDLIILDMTIPNFDKTDGKNGGNSYKNGGEIIVRELIDEDIEFRCMVLTQYETFNNETIDQISNRIKQKCGNNYLGYVKYSTLNNEWKDQIKKIIAYVKNIID